MHIGHRIVRGIVATLLVASFPEGCPGIAALGGMATFAGSVSDPSGALLADASVVIKNERTGEEPTVKTSTKGVFNPFQLKPSVYKIRGTSGASKFELPGIELVTGRTLTLDLQLSSGVTELVTLTADVPALDMSGRQWPVFTP